MKTNQSVKDYSYIRPFCMKVFNCGIIIIVISAHFVVTLAAT